MKPLLISESVRDILTLNKQIQEKTMTAAWVSVGLTSQQLRSRETSFTLMLLARPSRRALNQGYNIGLRNNNSLKSKTPRS